MTSLMVIVAIDHWRHRLLVIEHFGKAAAKQLVQSQEF